MTSTTDGPKQIQRYKIGYRTDEWGMGSSTPSAIPDPTGPLVKFDDAVQLVSGSQDALAELEQEARLMRARMERLQAELDGIVAAIGASGVQALSAAPAGFVPVSAFDRLHAHAESLGARLLAAEQATPKAAPQQEAQEPYPIDADPQGIRAVVADAITGALAFGAQGANPPPEGHWLTPFWEMAREEAMRIRPASVSRDTLYLLRRLLSNQHTLTGPEFRAELEKIVGEAYQQEAQEPTAISEAIERMAADRYKVVPSHESMFHRWAVVATGTQQLYLGREAECQNMARKFAGAFLDGAFVAMQQAAPQPAPAPLSEQDEREAVARAIWELMREHEDRCDMELDDLMEDHPIWSYADAARAALAAQGGK